MDVKVPQLAESVTEGDIGTWLKKDGESVRKNEAILELQTDKASLEIAAEADGVLHVLVEEGETVSVGDVVGRIEEGAVGDEGDSSEDESSKEEEASKREDAAPSDSDDAERSGDSSASRREQPAVAASADVRRDRPAPAPEPSSSSERATRDTDSPSGRAPQRQAVVPGPQRADEPGTRRERMTRMRRSIAQRLVEAQRTAAILTTFNEIDMTEVMALRKQHQEWFKKRHGVKLGFMSLFGRAVIGALESDVPTLNSFIDGDEVVHHDHVHLGIAVQTERGLVVPVIRDAHEMSLGELEQAIQRMAGLARDGKIGLEDLQGGTFTISNGGIYGSLLSTPILNPPQTGILGMHAIQQRPVVADDGEIVARPMMYVALSYDHRLIDGEEAVTFLVRLKERLEDPERMLLEA